jgi:alanine racemase
MRWVWTKQLPRNPTSGKTTKERKVAEGTRFEIHLPALRHNFQQIKKQLQTDTKILVVVKAFAYGSGATAIGCFLEKEGADYLGVAYVREGIALRNAGIQIPILVLHPQIHELSSLVEFQLEPCVYSWRILHALEAVLTAQKTKTYPIHLKFNTGLHRLGFSVDERHTLQQHLKSSSVHIQGVLSHLAATEDPAERTFTQGQLEQFDLLKPVFGNNPIYHVLNTSGVFNYPDAHHNMVRCGIGLYGYGNQKEVSELLCPVGVLKTVISQIHEVKVGDAVGYNRGFVADKPTRSATLPIGHADGIGRLYGKGKGAVVIHGHKAPILGNVCMDMIMVDVTNIDCKEGDEVILFGGAQSSAEEVAEHAQTISYELLTAISQRVPRVIVS